MAKNRIERKYNRALQIADFLKEGKHIVKDVCDEFQISEDTYREDMYFLATYGFGEELIKNQKLYIEAKTALYKEVSRRKRMKRG